MFCQRGVAVAGMHDAAHVAVGFVPLNQFAQRVRAEGAQVGEQMNRFEQVGFSGGVRPGKQGDSRRKRAGFSPKIAEMMEFKGFEIHVPF